MRVIIRESYETMSKWAAEAVAEKIRNAKGEKPFVLGLPTGSSPLGVYRLWAEEVAAGRLSFRNVVTFNMDEYVGLSPEDPESYHAFMEENLFSKIDLPGAQAHLLDGCAKDADAECRAYEEAIRRHGGIDLFLGGIGADGHIAFNEPFTSLSSRTGVRALTEDTRSANARFFGNDREKVPKYALSVGVGTVTDAREVMLLVSGRAKARALAAAVEGGVSCRCPASVLQLHEHAVIVCDEAAASELTLDTFRYFKEAENV